MDAIQTNKKASVVFAEAKKKAERDTGGDRAELKRALGLAFKARAKARAELKRVTEEYEAHVAAGGAEDDGAEEQQTDDAAQAEAQQEPQEQPKQKEEPKQEPSGHDDGDAAQEQKQEKEEEEKEDEEDTDLSAAERLFGFPTQRSAGLLYLSTPKLKETLRNRCQTL